MNGQQPKGVLTDGDHAMRRAITSSLPNATHRLCAWHFATNAGSNVPNGEFKIQFSKLLCNHYIKDDWKDLRKSAIEDHDLQNNEWATFMYAKKKNWAETFLRGKFVGGMHSTQRCESMNSYMRRFLDSKHLLRDFVSNIDQAIQNIRYTELQDDFTMNHTQPNIPSNEPLRPIFEQVAQVVTRNVYDLIAKQILGQNSFSVNTIDLMPDSRFYHFSNYQIGEVCYRVSYTPSTNHIGCTCFMMETDGIPCRHIFAVIKHLSIVNLPESLIRPCWRKNAKSYRAYIVIPPTMDAPDFNEIDRLGTLTSDFNNLGFYASKYEDTFLQARNKMHAMTQEFKNLFQVRQGVVGTSTDNFGAYSSNNNNILRDPIKVKTKGREKDATRSKTTNNDSPSEVRRKRCKLCNQLGHNKATCIKKQLKDASTGNQHDYYTSTQTPASTPTPTPTPTPTLIQTNFSQQTTSTMGLSTDMAFFLGQDDYYPYTLHGYEDGQALPQ